MSSRYVQERQMKRARREPCKLDIIPDESSELECKATVVVPTLA